MIRLIVLFASSLIRNGELDEILHKWRIPHLGRKRLACDDAEEAIAASDLTNATAIATGGLGVAILVALCGFYQARWAGTS
jgi:hypothetical protein